MNNQTLTQRCHQLWNDNSGIGLIAGVLFFFYVLSVANNYRRYQDERNVLSKTLSYISKEDGDGLNLTRTEKIIFLRSIGCSGGFDSEYPIQINHLKDLNLGHFGIYKNSFVTVENGPNNRYEIPRMNLMTYIREHRIIGE